MQPTKSTIGCGCGGGCGCSGCGKPARLPESAPAVCSPCDTASFIRPRFFAGQLLTEDDLGALIDYVVAKNRFHNARLFGDGVVCGLTVECGACDGEIVVQPGHALDGCGNDLVLTCQQTLDVAPMIRALAAQRGSCTDPCQPPVSSPSNGGEKPRQDAPPPNRHYCLYAKYAERPDQPVAAYPVADDCDAASCEPTRILEGIVFELRCPAECKPETIHDVEQRCAELLDADRDLTRTAVGFRSAAIALPAFSQRGAAYTDDEIGTLREGARAFDEIFAPAQGPERTLALARYLALVVGPYKRHALFQVELPPQLDEGQLERNEKIAIAALDDLQRSGAFADLAPLDAAIVSATINAYYNVERRTDIESPGVQAFLYGGAASPEMLAIGAQQLEEIAARLQQLAGCGSYKARTDCELPGMIDTLRPRWSRQGDRGDYVAAKDQLGAAAHVIERFLRDCQCAAINPPCLPCDDPGVLIACLEVDRCKVVRICNTARCHVLAPTALRYWGLFDPRREHARCCPERATGSRPDLGSYGLVPAPASFFYAPRTQHNLAYLTALAAPADLQERLIPSLAIPDPAPAHEGEIAGLKRQIAALASRIEQLERPPRVAPAETAPAGTAPAETDPASTAPEQTHHHWKDRR